MLMVQLCPYYLETSTYSFTYPCSSCCPYLTFVKHVLIKEAAHSLALMFMLFPATRIIGSGRFAGFLSRQYS